MDLIHHFFSRFWTTLESPSSWFQLYNHKCTKLDQRAVNEHIGRGKLHLNEPSLSRSCAIETLHNSYLLSNCSKYSAQLIFNQNQQDTHSILSLTSLTS
ncbi:hypothetical protein LR48_Vigan2366s000100 [Vigna angularis]|nr:hypothetical protein LR48_Vigan2366s000100 [Vigna angularis]